MHCLPGVFTPVKDPRCFGVNKQRCAEAQATIASSSTYAFILGVNRKEPLRTYIANVNWCQGRYGSARKCKRTLALVTYIFRS